MFDGAVKSGNIQFVYSSNDKIDEIKNLIGWNFNDVQQTKELNLTHNLIAPQAGFADLMNIYDKDKILDFKKRVTDYIKNNNITTDFSSNTFGEVIDTLNVTPTPAQQVFINDNEELYQSARSYLFEVFAKIYIDKDALIDDKKHSQLEESKKGSKRDALIKYLFKIQHNIFLFKTNMI